MLMIMEALGFQNRRQQKRFKVHTFKPQYLTMYNEPLSYSEVLFTSELLKQRYKKIAI